MNKIVIIMTLFVFIFTGCSCSKEDLVNTNNNLLSEIEKVENNSKQYEGLDEIFSWYNKITVESVNSFVLIESKSATRSLYTDGVIIASSGYNYYVIGDYNQIKQDGRVSFRIMDSNANVYDAKIAASNGSIVYDEYSGLALFKVSALMNSTITMKSIKLGELDGLSGHVSSKEHINKIQICENIKTSTINFNDASYTSYLIDDSLLTGTLINFKNELLGVYSSSLNSFIGKGLIENILAINYSLIL